MERVADFIPLGTALVKSFKYKPEERKLLTFKSVLFGPFGQMSGFLNLLSNLECVLILFNSFANV